MLVPRLRLKQSKRRGAAGGGPLRRRDLDPIGPDVEEADPVLHRNPVEAPRRQHEVPGDREPVLDELGAADEGERRIVGRVETVEVEHQATDPSGAAAAGELQRAGEIVLEVENPGTLHREQLPAQLDPIEMEPSLPQAKIGLDGHVEVGSVPHPDRPGPGPDAAIHTPLRRREIQFDAVEPDLPGGGTSPVADRGPREGHRIGGEGNP